MTGTTTDLPRIYVADLAAYNAGYLHGRWIDARQDADVIEADVRAMLAEIPDDVTLRAGYLPHDWPTIREEWAIHYYEGFGEIKLSEYESLENVSALAQLLEEHGSAFAAWWANDSSYDLDDAEYAFTEQYQGEWDSLEDYAREWLKDTGAFSEMTELAERYFNLEVYARDLQYSGDVWTADAGGGAIYVFLNV